MKARKIYKIKGVHADPNEPVKTFPPTVGRFKDAYAEADKSLAINKERWTILFAKPLNKWKPHTETTKSRNSRS